ncbi:MAG TPA: helix-turn-helix domain-containing protein [Nocardioides sp.]|uniref:helix-turn-helix transcriptional regulator n=1 Tax=Nocardioides sp. TaxID=35761 RepID=UPI002E35AA2B|nr:helix-turn-helix domain-containing protein [Nocardioides sp.]HEX5088512.1 helix-turn-helix domain-containing protein [Nocardioides sp.]
MDRAAVAAIAALDDDVRRALYEHVRAAGTPVTREEAAAAVGISRKLAAFHLDKLVELGVLRSGFGPPSERRVGRAPRRYEPAEEDIAVRVPERSPELLASILVEAVTSEGPDERAEDAVLRVARDRGARIGAAERARLRGGRVGPERALAASEELLAQQGFEPFGEKGSVRLRNCPFHPMAGVAPGLVCGLNHAYLAGLVEGLGAGDRVAAELAPRAGECCVELRPRQG